jgi:hypothetical protein
MKYLSKKRKAKIIGCFSFVVLVLFASITSYADENKVYVNQGQQKEILVARDVTLEHPVWCGNNALVISSERLGLRWINFLNNKTVKIHSSAYVGAVDCSPDGEWLIYVDTRSSRWDKGSYERGVVDFWRYNLKTGKRQKFAVASGGGKWSPDGTKFLFYGLKPQTCIEQPEPRWNLVWSGRGLSTEQGFVADWLSDSENIIITTISDDKVYIEKHPGNEPAQLLLPNIDLGDIYNLKIDKHNKIYILSRAKQKMNKKTIYGEARLLGCQTIGNDLQCEDILKRNKSIITYSISLYGRKIAFLEKGNSCVWLLQEGKGDSQCVALWAKDNFLRTYPDAGAILSISPDGKWMTFLRPRKIETIRGTDVYTNDLYLIKLINE